MYEEYEIRKPMHLKLQILNKIEYTHKSWQLNLKVEKNYVEK